MAFSADGRLLVTAGHKTAWLWDPATGNCPFTLGDPTNMARAFCAAFSPDGQLLVTAGRPGTARLWDPDTGNCLRTLTGHDGRAADAGLGPLPSDHDGALCVAFSPDGRLFATASQDETARLWD